jgi:hypothetical protein
MMMFAALSALATDRSVARRHEQGQATAEYALVIVGAATVAGLVLAWAASTGRISRLLNAVLDAVIGQVG